MYYVYILKNLINEEVYYGYTNNLERRIEEHNADNKWKCVYFEAYLSEKDARNRENKLKYYGQTRTHLKKRISESLSM